MSVMPTLNMGMCSHLWMAFLLKAEISEERDAVKGFLDNQDKNTPHLTLIANEKKCLSTRSSELQSITILQIFFIPRLKILMEKAVSKCQHHGPKCLLTNVSFEISKSPETRLGQARGCNSAGVIFPVAEPDETACWLQKDREGGWVQPTEHTLRRSLTKWPSSWDHLQIVALWKEEQHHWWELCSREMLPFKWLLWLEF